jgi:hypothetical protein
VADFLFWFAGVTVFDSTEGKYSDPYDAEASALAPQDSPKRSGGVLGYGRPRSVSGPREMAASPKSEE